MFEFVIHLIKKISMNGYSIYFIINFICFVIKYNVIITCLVLYINYFLQSLNVKCFGLENYYFLKKNNLLGCYHINNNYKNIFIHCPHSFTYF